MKKQKNNFFLVLRQNFAKYLKLARLGECVLMVGLFFIGSVFSIKSISISTIFPLVLYSLGAFFFILAVYSLNAYCGFEADKQNKRFKNLALVSSELFLYPFFAYTLIFLILFSLTDIRITFLALLSFIGWIWYYLPKYGLKYKPITGTLVHFFTQIIHFQMGYLLFEDLDAFSILISIYFAVLWVGAYLNHEVMDYEADKQTNVLTSAVYYGQQRIDHISFFLFIIGNIYLFILCALQQVSWWIALPFLFAFTLQFITKIYFELSLKGTIQQPKLYRNLYRLYYVLGSCLFVLLKLYKGIPLS